MQELTPDFKYDKQTIVVRDYIAKPTINDSTELNEEYSQDLQDLDIPDTVYFEEVKNFRFVMAFFSNLDKVKLKAHLPKINAFYSKWANEHTKNKG